LLAASHVQICALKMQLKVSEKKQSLSEVEIDLKITACRQEMTERGGEIRSVNNAKAYLSVPFKSKMNAVSRIIIEIYRNLLCASALQIVLLPKFIHQIIVFFFCGIFVSYFSMAHTLRRPRTVHWAELPHDRS